MRKNISDGNLQITYQCGEPYGIRDSSGFILFFPKLVKYQGQTARYEKEVKLQCNLACFLLANLEGMK